MAYLTLKDGTVYEGKSFGYKGDAVGEVVFNTGMTGYQELLTDPSYTGQIVNMTYPLIGNYGINSLDIESDSPKVRGFIVRDYTETPSNWRCEMTLDDYLDKFKIAGLYGIDTRALTRKLRSYGTMNGIITQQPATKEQLEAVAAYTVKKPVEEVTVKSAYEIKGDGLKVAVLDYGIKRNIVRTLEKKGYDIKVFPARATAQEILDFKPDGVMLSNGPGDPKDNVFEIEQLKKLIGKTPIFGICLGHQLMALAFGGETKKMVYGHRGSNHPVKDVKTGRVYITSQNHGYTVESESLIGKGILSFINWNDKSCEGIDYTKDYAFSVQFHPEYKPGPEDTAFLFDRFDTLMRDFKRGVKNA